LEPIEYLRTLRRRWRLVAAAVIVAMAAGILTTTVAKFPSQAPAYQGTAVLLTTSPDVSATGLYGAQPVNLDTLAALSTVGEVPDRVARALKYQGNPLDLTSAVRAEAVEKTAVLKITSTASTPQRAKLLADTFANELVAFFVDQETKRLTQQAQVVQAQLDAVKGDLEDLGRRLVDTPDNALLAAQRDAKVREYGFLYDSYQQLATQIVNPAAGLRVIQNASPAPATGGIHLPRSPFGRTLVAAILGLLLGVALALTLERFDVRIRNKDGAEGHFGLPVLAEIPHLQWRQRRRGMVVVASSPKSPSADAFRLLGIGIARPLESRNGKGSSTILVTSAGPGDGKTTVVANLAATFGELGKRVLVLSCDFHRPKVHRLLGLPNYMGLTDALTNGNGKVLEGHIWETPVRGVRLVPSGRFPEKPTQLLSSPKMIQAIEEARRYADIVIIDTPPILALSDATHLLPQVDAVVVVARAGKTTAGEAAETADLLKRFEAPTAGVVLNAVSEGALGRRYYYYYSDAKR
jgi:capsular exopolysaccharide synthesis family protein